MSLAVGDLCWTVVALTSPREGDEAGARMPRRSARTRVTARSLLAARDVGVARSVAAKPGRVDLGERARALAPVGVEALPARASRFRALQVEVAGAKDDAVALDVGDRVTLGGAGGARAGARCVGRRASASAAAVGAISATRVWRVAITWYLLARCGDDADIGNRCRGFAFVPWARAERIRSGGLTHTRPAAGRTWGRSSEFASLTATRKGRGI